MGWSSTWRSAWGDLCADQQLARTMSAASRRPGRRWAAWGVPALLVAAVVALLAWLHSVGSWRAGTAGGLAPAATQQLGLACRHWAAVDRLGGCAALPHRPTVLATVGASSLPTPWPGVTAGASLSLRQCRRWSSSVASTRMAPTSHAQTVHPPCCTMWHA